MEEKKKFVLSKTLLWMISNPFIQFFRLIVICFKILSIVRKGH